MLLLLLSSLLALSANKESELFNNHTTTVAFDADWDLNSSASESQLPASMRQLYQSMKNGVLSPSVTSIACLFVSKEGRLQYTLEGVLKSGERLIDAELFVYRSVRVERHDSSYITRLYKVLHGGNFTANPDLNELLNVAYISAKSGWQVFKVKEAAGRWLRGDQNLGFLITARDFYENAADVSFHLASFGPLRPFLVLYLGNDRKSTPKGVFALDDPKHTEGCIKKPKRVDFKQVGWDNFIIEPKGLQINECSGRCHPKQLTNNGLFHLVFKANAEDKHQSRCVPLRYSSAPIMFFDKSGNVAIKMYEQMVVEACGCR